MFRIWNITVDRDITLHSFPFPDGLDTPQESYRDARENSTYRTLFALATTGKGDIDTTLDWVVESSHTEWRRLVAHTAGNPNAMGIIQERVARLDSWHPAPFSC